MRFRPTELSWYESSASPRKVYPMAEGSFSCDLLVIGAGFTGLSAAYYLAKAGLNVIILEADRVGNGASGRNGGQWGTGQRQWIEELEKQYGFERTKALFSLAEQAKAHIYELINQDPQRCDYQEGQISAMHRARFERSYKTHIETMARYGYKKLHFLDKVQMEAQTGSGYFHGGILDEGTGHIHPLKLVYNLAQLATEYGAKIFEQSKALSIEACHVSGQQQYLIKTDLAQIRAPHILLATNGYNLGLRHPYQNYVESICSYIGALPLREEDRAVLPFGQAVDDSRFVVRYFRRTKENVLLFGGVERYSRFARQDVTLALKQQISEIYPSLSSRALTHYWGGLVGITVARMPFVREVKAGITYCGGYSGHGVMLAPFIGKLYAETLLGQSEALYQFKDLKMSPFPGGRVFRSIALFLALHYFSLLDRL